MIKEFVIIALLLLPLAAAQAPENSSLNSSFGVENASLDIESLSADCARQYECQKSGQGYWFECGYDEASSDCRCYLGEFSRCNVSRSNISISTPAKQSSWITAWAVAKVYSGKAAAMAINSSLRVKVSVLGALMLLIAFVYFSRRDDSGRDLKRAAHYHKLAENAYGKGDSEKSQKYYELSNYYREKGHQDE